MMARPIRIAGSVVVVLVCLFAVLTSATSITLTYSLPSHVPGQAITRTAVYTPALVGTSVAAALTALSAIWLIWNIVAEPPKRLWIASAVALIAVIVIMVLLAGAARPTF